MRTFTLSGLLLFIGGSAFAQPIIVNTMPTAPVGFTDSVYGATPGVAPGTGGASVTWNLSTLTPSKLGSVLLVTPSTSPYSSTFPTATTCGQITPATGGTAYSYEKISATKWESLSTNYSGTGTGKDYSPNPESFLKFPFNYLESFIDTFQTTTGGPYTVTITYDGYGTLVTPFATYTNVVRIKKDWGPGDYGYYWYATTPYLRILTTFDAQKNSYTIIGHPGTTDVKPAPAQSFVVSVCPNPFTGRTTIVVDGVNELNNALIAVSDMTGRTISQSAILKRETLFESDNLNPGIYLYRVFNDGKQIANGKLIIK